PAMHVGVPVRIAVPNNDMDVPAAAWAAGRAAKKQPSELKTLKTLRSTHLLGPDTVHYLYDLPQPLTEDVRGAVEAICAAARCITHLGWGVDMVAGNGRILGEEDPDDPRRQAGCEVWRVTEGRQGVELRVPRRGTLDALCERHRAFLSRLEG